MPAIVLTPAQRKEHRALAHHLEPVVMIGGDGLSPAVLREIDAALKAHGYAVVPREPTQGMMNAYRHAFVSEKRFDMREVWSSMLTASVKHAFHVPPVGRVVNIHVSVFVRIIHDIFNILIYIIYHHGVYIHSKILFTQYQN